MVKTLLLSVSVRDDSILAHCSDEALVRSMQHGLAVVHTRAERMTGAINDPDVTRMLMGEVSLELHEVRN